jgi:hypothetical protein
MNDTKQEVGFDYRTILDEGMQEEIRTEVKSELAAISEGRLEDPILLKAVAGNWSIEQFTAVARRRGRGWRFQSALADKALEVQGVALLHVVADVMGHSLREATVVKALNSLARLDGYRSSFVFKHGADPRAQQIVEDAQDEVMEQGPTTRRNFSHRVEDLLRG